MILVTILLLLLSGFSLAEPSPSTVIDNKAAIIHFPEKLTIWNISPGDNQKRRIFLRQGGKENFSITDIEVSNSMIEILSREQGGKQQQTYVVTFQVDGDGQSGPFEEVVTLHTTHPQHPVITVPVNGNILSEMVVDPPALSMRLGVVDRSATGFIKLTSGINKSFEITDVRISHPSVIADIKPAKECCGYYIAILVEDKEQTIKKPLQAYLRLQTDASQQVVLIPLLINVSQ